MRCDFLYGRSMSSRNATSRGAAIGRSVRFGFTGALVIALMLPSAAVRAQSIDLCVHVNDPGKHAQLAVMAKCYLAYVDCTRPSGEKMQIAAAVTAGDSDNLFVGRNGLFYDRKGRDWDATISKIVDNPISIGQAFWAPYKKLLRWIEEQVAKRAAAADDQANAHLQAGATAAGATGAPPAPAAPKKLDIGVVAAIQERRYRRGTPEYGEAMETYVMHELKSYTDYVSGEPLAYWRSKSGFEVDYILGDHTAIELKASENVAANDLKSLKALAEEGKLKRYLCVSLEARRRQVGEVTILPVREFLDNLWDGAYS